MSRQHRVALIASLVLILIIGACGTQTSTPTSGPGEGTTPIVSTTPTATPPPTATPTPVETPTTVPTTTPVALSFIRQPTQIVVGGRLKDVSGDADTDFGIYSVDTDGMNLQRVDPAGMMDFYPTWSPDGRQIAFTRLLPSNASAEWMNSVIVVMNADGTNERVLTSSDEFAINSVWSPDGNQIAFERFTLPLGPEEMPDAVVSVMNTDGTNLHDVGHVGYVIGTPSWSPDGSQLVFAGATATEPSPGQEGRTSISVVRSDGSDLNEISSGIVLWPVWSPDGSQIAYLKGADITDQQSSSAMMSFSIWVMEADGSNPRALTDDRFLGAFFPAWSPDGTQIAFVGVEDPSNTGIYVMNADGSNLHQLVEGLTQDKGSMVMAPSWSPDGTGIAHLAVPTTPGTFDSDLVGSELRLVAADGSEQGTILSNFFVEPAFDPFDIMGSTAPAWRPVGP